MPQYLPLGNVAAPASWTLPADLRLQLGAVFAHFDGTSAAGSYIPTLQIVSDSGNTCLEIPMESSVAAGSSVEASWAPFLRGAASASVSVQVAPSVATFYRSDGLGDPALTVATGSLGVNIPWLHASLPSDGSITGPFISDWYAQFNVPCMTVEFLRVTWDDAGYLKAGVLGTDDRIGFNDMYSLANAGVGTHASWGDPFGDSTLYVRPNAHLANDLVHAYVQQDSGVDKTVVKAYLTVYLWPAPGYAGGIPGYP